ncbi:MAG: hypothetical protein SO119_03375 [Phascolarctobacterium sp.]|nr:hypothetical protein [Phascolarctobacterium sp.]
MKRLVLLAGLLICLLCPSLALAAETSSDKMILDWTTTKVWVSGESLCVSGTFVNKRSDLTITKLNDFLLRLRYTDKDGKEQVFEGRPVKLPLCKIPASSSKKLNLVFGKFDSEIHNWVTTQSYQFTYINGARF